MLVPHLRISLTAQIPSTSMHSRAGRLVVPAQVRVVAELSGFDEVRDGEERAEHDADATDDHVGDAEEGVLTAHYGSSGDDNGLCAAVFGYVEIWRKGISLVVEDEEGRRGGNVRWSISTEYRPEVIVAVSLRCVSLLKVGRPARRIQTWNCSSFTRSGW